MNISVLTGLVSHSKCFAKTILQGTVNEVSRHDNWKERWEESIKKWTCQNLAASQRQWKSGQYGDFHYVIENAFMTG